MVQPVCAFESDRLTVKGWHTLDDTHPVPLADIVCLMLTAPVTDSLPEDWRGPYSRQRADEWIAARDNEGDTLIALDKATQQPVGLWFLHEVPGQGPDNVEIRIGYLLSEPHWGRGLATELIGAFVRWCETNRPGSVIVAGVAASNPASIAVLRKNGFTLASAESTPTELTYKRAVPA